MSPADSGLTVAELAHEWAAAARPTTSPRDPPLSGEQSERLLVRLIDRLVTAVASDLVDEQAASEVAAELVEHDLTGSSGIGRSIEILGAGLPRLAQLQHVDQRDAAILRVLGALANGYAQALVRAKQDTERALRLCRERIRQILSVVPVGIAISDLRGTVVTANRAFATLLGRSVGDLIGAPVADLLHAEDDPVLGPAYREFLSGEATYFRHRGQLRADNGEATWTFLAGSPLRDPDGVATHQIIIVEDITELQLLQQELAEQTLHDMLTGLPNEHHFMSRLKDVLEGAEPSSLVTVCRVNLDNFSVINDGIGRSAGQQLLRSVARRLQDLVVGERAMVARLGADDFAILIEGGIASRDLSMFVSKINIRLCEPISINDKKVAVSAGVGVVRRSAGGITAEELVRSADATLHRAKRSGRGQWGLYDPQADAQEREHYQLAAEIPGAWENGEIEIYYQPLCSLDSGGIVAVRVSLHWDRADGTVVGHSECLALAERSGLLTPLGRWLVQEACIAQSVVLSCPNSGNPRMRVDLTTQLSQDPDLIGVLTGALFRTGLEARQLRIGVPLAALVRARGDVMDNVGVLAELGAEVVLLGATAGPGYMGYLEDLPVGAVEIAPTTVARLVERPGDDSAVAQAVLLTIPLIHSAGATVIVPGVHTAEQAQWWRGAGADSARGDHFGPPVRGSELPSVLTAAFHRRQT